MAFYMAKMTSVCPIANPITVTKGILTITIAPTPSHTITLAVTSLAPTALKIPFPCESVSNAYWWKSMLTARWLLMSRCSSWISRR